MRVFTSHPMSEDTVFEGFVWRPSNGPGQTYILQRKLVDDTDQGYDAPGSGEMGVNHFPAHHWL